MIASLEHTMNKLNIFLVDDQKITNFINKKLINVTGIGKKIYEFISPMAALEELEDKKPHIILLDHNMPEINGWKFLELMEQYNTDAKVVIVTSSTSQVDVQKAKDYKRVIHYLTKPLNVNSIKELTEIYSSNK
ncbi:MAG: response regulator [Leeuwenhoekiella sp.]